MWLKAFTMIELLFVIVVISILMAVAIPKMVKIRDSSITVNGQEFKFGEESPKKNEDTTEWN